MFIKHAAPPTQTTSAQTVDSAGTGTSVTSATDNIKLYMLEIERLKQQYEEQIKTYEMQSRLYRQAGIHSIPGMRLDEAGFYMESNIIIKLDDNGQMDYVVFYIGDKHQVVSRDEFLRRVKEGDILCVALYHKYVGTKLKGNI